MKKKRRCNLCGAKLTGDICPECGYNNASYHINRTADECTHSSVDRYYSEEEHQEHMDPEPESYRAYQGGQENAAQEDTAQGNSEAADRWDYRDVQQKADEEYAEQYQTDSNYGASNEAEQTGREYEDKEQTAGYDGSGAYDGIPNQETVTYGLNEERKRKKKSEWKKIIGMLVLIWLLPNLISFVTGAIHQVSNMLYETQTTTSMETFPEDNVSDATADEVQPGTTEGNTPDSTTADDALSDIPEAAAQTGADTVSLTGGGDWKGTIRQGNYIAGINLPVGTYEAVLTSGYGDFYVYNEAEYIISEYFTADEKDSKRTISDIELTAGTNIILNGSLSMELTAQDTLGYMEQPQNPLAETITVEDAMICGRDFEPGTYHVRWLSGSEYYGMLIRKFRTHLDFETTDTISLSEEEPLYSNMVAKEGDAFLKVNCELQLEPAEYDISAYSLAY